MKSTWYLRFVLYAPRSTVQCVAVDIILIEASRLAISAFISWMSPSTLLISWLHFLKIIHTSKNHRSQTLLRFFFHLWYSPPTLKPLPKTHPAVKIYEFIYRSNFMWNFILKIQKTDLPDLATHEFHAKSQWQKNSINFHTTTIKLTLENEPCLELDMVNIEAFHIDRTKAAIVL